MPLRRHLFGLVVAVLLPALAFGAAASWAALRSWAAVADARLVDTASAFAATIDMQIRAQEAALTVLAAATRLEGQDAAQFESLARGAAQVFGGWVVILEANGRVVLNTAMPGELMLPETGGQVRPEVLAAIRRALATDLPVVTDLIQGRGGSGQASAQGTASRAAFIFVPLEIEGGRLGRVIGMPLRPEQLTRILAGAMAGRRGAVALTDARGVFVAHSRDAADLVGRQGPPPATSAPSAVSGLMQGRSLTDGRGLRIAWRRIASAPGWTVWVNEPEELLAAALRGPILALVGGGLLALGLGALLARILSWRLLRPVEALVAHAEAVASGSRRLPDSQPSAQDARPARVLEFDRLRLAVTAAEGALREAEAQYRRVQVVGGVGGFIVDLTQTEPSRSARVLGLEGRPALSEELGHAAWLRRIHPADRDRAEQYFRAVTADGAATTEYAQDYRVLEPDGEARWISARAEIERDAAGRALRMIGAHVDITRLKHAEAALRDGEERLRLALDAASMGAWEADLRSGLAIRTPRTLAIFGFGPEERVGAYPAWREGVHPEDRQRLDDAVAALRRGGTDRYQVTYRFRRPDGAWRWVEIHARAAERDPATREALRMIGTALDITERREAEDRQKMLTREVDHRAKNALTMVNAALRLTPREDADAFAAAVEGRVAALARAHTLLAEEGWSGADLRAIAAGELAPFLLQEGIAMPLSSPVAELQGPPLRIGPTAVQGLSMAFHELASNAIRHGALSRPGGRLHLDWKVTGPAEDPGSELRLCWRETGAAIDPGLARRRGFGLTLVEATIRQQLGGRLTASWLPEGLRWEASLGLARILSDGLPAVSFGPPEGG